MEFQFNKSPDQKEYLASLNECFSNWGDDATFSWVFRKPNSIAAPDLFEIRDEEENLLAGSALTYRKVKMPDGDSFAMGTMTGSWTLPLSRGKGCFTEMIRYSKKLVKDHHFDFLTAFVTEQNASFRRLEAEGSFLVPTNYIMTKLDVEDSEAKAESTFEVLEVTSQNIEIVYQQRQRILSKVMHYDYSLQDFTMQFFNRPHLPIVILKHKNNYIVLEKTTTVFRILFSTDYSFGLISELLNWSLAQERNLFFLTTNVDHEFKNDDRFTTIPGYFTVLNAQHEQRLAAATIFNNRINIEYGDKM